MPTSTEEIDTNASLATFEEGTVRLTGDTSHELSLLGNYRPGEFNLIEVQVHTTSGVRLRCGLKTTGVRPIGSHDVPHLKPGESAWLAFDVRGLASAKTDYEELVLSARSPQYHTDDVDWTLLGVRLIDRPLEAWLPRPEEGPALVEVNGDARMSVGISAASGEYRLQVPGPGRLLFCCASAPRLPLAEGRLGIGNDDFTLHHEASETWSESWFYVEKAGEYFVKVDGDGLFLLEQPFWIRDQELAPTVTLITSDTHRADHLGHAGGDTQVDTPALDALAARGVTFTDCFVSSNHTLPSHVTLMTGHGPAATGVTDNYTRLADRATTLAERFSESGYVSLAVTSAKHLNDEWSGLGQGFDRFGWPHSDRERPAESTLDVTREWLDHMRGVPLFLWLHVFDAHRPYLPPESITRQYYGEGDPRAESLPEPPWPRPGTLHGVRDDRWVRDLYRAEVTALDAKLAGFFEMERIRAGILAFTSDHGESLGENGIWWDHVGVYPEVLHVPLILAWADAPQGEVITRPVRQADVARTLLDLAELSNEGIGGRNLLEGSGAYRFAFGSEGHALSVTADGWQLVVNLAKPEGSLMVEDLPVTRPVGLFELRAEPRSDRSSQETERMKVLSRALVDWVSEGPYALAERQEASAESAELLASLGYASGGDEDESHVDLDRLREILAPWID